MCTATWLIQPQGFELFFNRDENVRRGRALPPRQIEIGGVRVIAPQDADAGGTWLGVNELGLAVGLLNARDERDVENDGAEVDGARSQPTVRRSRGLLVRALLAASDPRAALAALARESLVRYRAFTLLVLAPGVEPSVRAWDGRTLAVEEARLPLASSSLDGGRAREERERVFGRLREQHGRVDRALLARFHASHAPERGAWSPCMHRADAATVSTTEVRVDARTIALRYADGPPCTAAHGPWIEIERRLELERGT